jgi:hypothetical protein
VLDDYASCKITRPIRKAPLVTGFVSSGARTTLLLDSSSWVSLVSSSMLSRPRFAPSSRRDGAERFCSSVVRALKACSPSSCRTSNSSEAGGVRSTRSWTGGPGCAGRRFKLGRGEKDGPTSTTRVDGGPVVDQELATAIDQLYDELDGASGGLRFDWELRL